MGGLYVSFDFKVAEIHAPGVARAAGVSEDRVIAGLVRMWHRCWNMNSDLIDRAGLASCFGPDRLDDLVAQLSATGDSLPNKFLEPSGTSWRIRGASRYTRLKAALSAGGKKSAGNLKRGNSPGPRAGEEPGDSPGQLPALLLNDGMTECLNDQRPAEKTSIKGAVNEMLALAIVDAEKHKAPAEKLREIWNEAKPKELPPWLKTGPSRLKTVKARLAEEPDLEVWRKAIASLAGSGFHLGQNDRKWRANPDWLLRPDTLTKLLEANHTPPPTPKPTGSFGGPSLVFR